MWCAGRAPFSVGLRNGSAETDAESAMPVALVFDDMGLWRARLEWVGIQSDERSASGVINRTASGMQLIQSTDGCAYGYI